MRKNSLLKKAIDEDGLSSLDSALKGPTALVTAVEEGAGLKVLNDFYEDHSKKFAIKGGVIGGVYCGSAETCRIGSYRNQSQRSQHPSFYHAVSSCPVCFDSQSSGGESSSGLI